MSWARFDDGFLTNPKAMAAGIEGRALFFASVLYSSRELTDGLVAGDVVPGLAGLAGVKRPKAAVEALVKVGLWEKNERGFTVHDYLIYNPSRKQVMEEREKAAARVGKWRNNRRTNARSNGVTNAVSNASVTAAPEPLPDPLPPNDSLRSSLSPGDGDEDVGFSERYGTLVTALGGHLEQRTCDEFTNLAEDYSLEDLNWAIRECRSDNKRPYPSEVRGRLHERDDHKPKKLRTAVAEHVVLAPTVGLPIPEHLRSQYEED